jgi:hypothetical protein
MSWAVENNPPDGKAGRVRESSGPFDERDRDFVEVVGAGFVGFRDAFDLAAARIERCVLHAERFEDALLQKILERFTRNDFDDAAQRVDAGIVVFPFAAGLGLQRLLRVQQYQVAQREVAPCAWRVGNSGSVSQQVLECDGPSRPLERQDVCDLLPMSHWFLNSGKCFSTGSSIESLPSSARS